MATEKKAVTVYLDRALYARVEGYARGESRSLSNLIERTLTQAFPLTGEEFKLTSEKQVQHRKNLAARAARMAARSKHK
jgi:hypothetical protein